MTLHQQSPLAIGKESRPRVVSQVEQVENSPTKTSFMKLPPSMNNSNKSHYGAMIQEAADNHPSINVMQLPNPATLPTTKPTISTSAYTEDLISIPKSDKLDDFKISAIGTVVNPTASDETQHHVLLGNKLDAGDSYLGFLRNKKGTETSLYSNGIANTSVISDPKLKKATNPSIASLRGISESGVSTPTGTISKGSSRAEFFAAKLHDAIKDDRKNKDDSNETFVYDTTTSNAAVNEPDLDFSGGAGTGTSVSTKVKDDVKSNTITDCHSSIVSPSEVNTVHQGSPYLSKFPIDDGFDLMSKSSTNSKNVSQQKSSKETTSDEVHNVHQMSKIEEHHPNQLRQITSKLFDSKGVQPRRYSGVQNDISQNGDSFDEDFEYYGGSNMLNANLTNINPPSTLGSTQNANIIYSIGENDSDFEDQLSTYFDKNYQRTNPLLQSTNNNNDRINSNNDDNNNNNNNNTNNNTTNNNNTSNYNSHHLQFLHDGIFKNKFDENNESANRNLNNNHNFNYNNPYYHFNDYGSITNDNKNKQRRKRSDIYVSPHDFTSLRTQRIKQVRSFCYTAVGIISLLFIGFVFGFILATNKELQLVEVIEVTDVIVGQEVFLFDMIVDAFNPGILPISIKNVQLDIFAKTMYVIDDEPDNDPKKKYETVLLGSIEQLEIPLSFEGGFFTRQHDISVTEVKLLNPCSFNDDDDHNNNNNNDDDNNDENDNLNTKYNYEIDTWGIDNKRNSISDSNLSVSKSSSPHKVIPPSSKWLNISRNPFDLIIRGAMLYELPLSSNNHTVSISYTTYIDPNDLDIGY